MINRNDLVVYRGATWRCDYADEEFVDGIAGNFSYRVLGLSNGKGEHCEAHHNAVELIENPLISSFCMIGIERCRGDLIRELGYPEDCDIISEFFLQMEGKNELEMKLTDENYDHFCVGIYVDFLNKEKTINEVMESVYDQLKGVFREDFIRSVRFVSGISYNNN